MSPRPQLTTERPIRWVPSVNVGPADVQTLLDTLQEASPLRVRLAQAFHEAKVQALHLNALDRHGVAGANTEHPSL